MEFFSLGGVLRIWWTPRVLELPWIIASASLLLLSCWDLFDGAGRMDFILMGLAGYELVIGFTEEEDKSCRSSNPYTDGRPASANASSCSS